MKKIIILSILITIVILIYILGQMELILLNKTITADNIYYIAKEVDKSKLSEEKKDKIISNIILYNKKCYGKKVKELMK